MVRERTLPPKTRHAMTQTSTARKLSKTSTVVTKGTARRYHAIREENLEKPATARQRFALMCAFRKIGRTDNPYQMELTMGDAHRLLSELSKTTRPASVTVVKTKPTLRDQLKTHLLAEMPTLVAALRGALGIKSVVKNDTSMVKDDGKRYLFVGTGCSIVYLKYDGRSKKAKEIEEAAYTLHRELMPTLLSHFDYETRSYYAKHGCPLEAVAQQDMNCNSTYWYAVQNFMTRQGIKNVRVVANYD